MGILRCCCADDANTGDFYGPAGATGPADLMDPAPEEARADEASRDMLWEGSTEITGGRFPFDGPDSTALRIATEEVRFKGGRVAKNGLCVAALTNTQSE